ncbi:hypothetical protein ACP275_11G088600 [Erythranthe tilingii]
MAAAPNQTIFGYYILSSNEPEFLPGRQASIIYKGKQVGTFGIVHPQVFLYGSRHREFLVKTPKTPFLLEKNTI